MKEFEKEYISSIEKSAPDMDKLWEKIAASECEDSDITPFESAAEECSGSRLAKTGYIYRTFAAVAAVFAAVICLSLAMNNNDEGILDTEKMNSVQSASDEYTEDFYSEDAQVRIYGTDGWEYSETCSSASSYSTLNLAETDSGIYTALSSNTDETEYFVEAEVLAQTDYFVDGRIISSEIHDDHIVYTLDVIHLISDDGMSVPAQITAVSKSPYTLRRNREYLLPIREENGTAVIVFDNAPQIEIADDRTVICHNGWKSLMESSEYISYPQVCEDDYFYDRMNIAAESSLGILFENWEDIRR